MNSSNLTDALNGHVTGGNISGLLISDQEVLNINVPLTILYALVFLFGVTGNLLVIFVIYRNPDMSTATNIFLVNLSLADLFVLLVCMPIGLIDMYSKDVWLLGGFMCKFTAFLEIGVTNASVMTMLAISFERYYAICRPLEVLYTCTKGRAMKIILSLWMFSLLSASPFFVISYVRYEVFLDNTTNPTCRNTIETAWEHAYNWAIFIIFFMSPCLILMALYGCICKELLKSRRGMINSETIPTSSNAKRSKSLRAKLNLSKRSTSTKESTSATSNSAVLVSSSGTKSVLSGSGFGCHYALQHTRAIQSRRQVIYMLITVIVFSFSCLLPMRVMTLWIIYSSPETHKSLGFKAFTIILHFARIMFYINSAGNPILYNMMSTKFREACKRSLGLVCTGGKLLYTGTQQTGHMSRHQSCRRSESTTKAETMEYESLTPLTNQDNNQERTVKVSV